MKMRWEMGTECPTFRTHWGLSETGRRLNIGTFTKQTYPMLSQCRHFGYETDHNGHILHTKVIYATAKLYQNLKFTETMVGKISGITIHLLFTKS